MNSNLHEEFHIKDEEDEAVTITTNDTNNDKVTLIEDDLNTVTDDTVSDIVEVTTKEDEKENVNSRDKINTKLAVKDGIVIPNIIKRTNKRYTYSILTPSSVLLKPCEMSNLVKKEIKRVTGDTQGVKITTYDNTNDKVKASKKNVPKKPVFKKNVFECYDCKITFSSYEILETHWKERHSQHKTVSQVSHPLTALAGFGHPPSNEMPDDTQVVTITTHDTTTNKVTLLEDDLNSAIDDASSDIIEVTPIEDDTISVTSDTQVVTITTNDTTNDKVTLLEDDLNSVTDDTVSDIVELTPIEDDVISVTSDTKGVPLCVTQSNDEDSVESIEPTKKIIVDLNFQCKFCAFYGVSTKAILVHAQKAHKDEWFRMKTWNDIAKKLLHPIPVESKRTKPVRETETELNWKKNNQNQIPMKVSKVTKNKVITLSVGSSSSDKKIQESIKSPKNQNVHKCHVCYDNFEVLEELFNHMSKNHKLNFTKCDYCHFKSNDRDMLRRHVKKEHEVIQSKPIQSATPKLQSDSKWNEIVTQPENISSMLQILASNEKQTVPKLVESVIKTVIRPVIKPMPSNTEPKTNTNHVKVLKTRQDILEAIKNEENKKANLVTCFDCNSNFADLKDLVDHWQDSHQAPLVQESQPVTPSVTVTKVPEQIVTPKVTEPETSFVTPVTPSVTVTIVPEPSVPKLVTKFVTPNVTEPVTPSVARNYRLKNENYSLQCYLCGLKVKPNVSNPIVTHIIDEHNLDHITNYMYGIPRTHQCPDCKLMFKSEEDLKLHICGQLPPFWLIGANDNNNQCPKCDKKFKTYGRLLHHHATVHSQVHNFACELCDYTAVHPANVRQHEREMHKVGDFRCNKCNFQCESKFILKNHKLSNHAKEPKLKPVKQSDVQNCEIDESTIHECEKCIIGFANQKDFIAHLESDHVKPKKPKGSLEKRIEEPPKKKARNELEGVKTTDLQMDVTSEFRCDYCDKESFLMN